MKILVTGGAGFIGSNLVRLLVSRGHQVLNIDKLTYAGNPHSLSDLQGNPNHQLLQADICDAEAMRKAFADFRPEWIMHLAAESHVDRSIDGPSEFIQTNIVGTYVLLQTAREYISTFNFPLSTFRFLHVSTDEVYGSLGEQGLFTETTSYDPHSPYSASKAASDHLRAACHCYELLKQLRPLPISGKTHPGRHSQSSPRRADPCLWQRRKYPRLALCRRPCRSPPYRYFHRQNRRNLQHRRQQRNEEHRSCKTALRLAG